MIVRIVMALVVLCLWSCNEKKEEQKPLYDYDVEERVRELGIELQEAKAPSAMKIALAVQNGNMLYLSGNIPFTKEERYVGKLGSDLTTEEGYQAARLVGINHLSTLKTYLGDLNRVEKIVKVLGMVNSEPSFVDQSKVLNGFSDLMYEVFGERGRHARSAVGMASIPFNGACEIEMIVQIRGQIEPQTHTENKNMANTTAMTKNENQSKLISAQELSIIRENKEVKNTYLFGALRFN